jgi:predicted deacetylase
MYFNHYWIKGFTGTLYYHWRKESKNTSYDWKVIQHTKYITPTGVFWITCKSESYALCMLYRKAWYKRLSWYSNKNCDSDMAAFRMTDLYMIYIPCDDLSNRCLLYICITAVNNLCTLEE